MTDAPPKNTEVLTFYGFLDKTKAPVLDYRRLDGDKMSNYQYTGRAGKCQTRKS